MNSENDPMVLISEYYSDVYTQFVPVPLPQQGVEEVMAGKPRRRRRKKESGGGEGEMRKRKLSEAQVNLLERSFGSDHKLESERKDRLAAEMGLDPRQVAVWFQNRRARWKSKKLEAEYSKLKAEHDNAVLHKCRLQTELLDLKDQLNEARREIQRLSERSEGFSSNSPTSSSFSMEHMDPPFLGEFGFEGLENVICMPENNYDNEWGSLYNYM
ncbi:hypothetical protein CASFOL_037254 [Castilleja foliolosa]|uniref:Homeobox-leucine zipper protein n=1 Tax=Castilleja foliolosa TaxID=1961234 RepID=A0ABD3BNE9_9LAMI